MSQRQCGRCEDRGRRAGITLSSQNVDDDVGGMNAVGDRLGAGDFDRQQSVGENRGEDVDHLPIAVMGARKLARRTRSIAAGSTQSLKGAPLRKAPGLRASTGT